MKNLILASILLALTVITPFKAMADVDISIGITLPPIVFDAPPSVVVVPDTDYVYVVPDIAVDLFFWNGWWWRLWGGAWYRSPYYDRGWVHYNSIPRFYFDVDPYWRDHYRHRDWYGHPWNYKPIPYPRLENNWKTWQSNKYWNKRGYSVKNYKPMPQYKKQELRKERQDQYYRRPDVKPRAEPQQQQPKQHYSNQPQAEKSKGKKQEQMIHQPMTGQGQPGQQPRNQGNENRGKSQPQHPQGGSDGKDMNHQR